MAVYAVTPRLNGGGLVLHLYVPGYQPGAKSRRPAEAAMCNAPVWKTLSWGPQKDQVIRRHVPLAEALAWASSPPPDPFDPRPAWRWCPVCVGRLVELYGDLGAVLHALEIPTNDPEQETP